MSRRDAEQTDLLLRRAAPAAGCEHEKAWARSSVKSTWQSTSISPSVGCTSTLWSAKRCATYCRSHSNREFLAAALQFGDELAGSGRGAPARRTPRAPRRRWRDLLCGS